MAGTIRCKVDEGLGTASGLQERVKERSETTRKVDGEEILRRNIENQAAVSYKG